MVQCEHQRQFSLAHTYQTAQSAHDQFSEEMHGCRFHRLSGECSFENTVYFEGPSQSPGNKLLFLTNLAASIGYETGEPTAMATVLYETKYKPCVAEWEWDGPGSPTLKKLTV